LDCEAKRRSITKSASYEGKLVRQFIVNGWNFVFNSNVSPLRHIPDVATRHYVLQILGFMWAVCSAIAIGSYTVFAASILGHAVLIAAAAVTVATYTAAAKKPQFFTNPLGRRDNGEHD
jgi:drug/metabolite transporter (DMT)-like permease